MNLKRGSLIFAWGLYDLANQFFAVNVVSLWFALWLIVKMNVRVPEVFYGISFGISTLLVALVSPILGAISDKIERRQPFLICLTLLSVIFTMLIGSARTVFWGLLFFAIANFGCQTAVVFYNALMVNIAVPDKMGLISGIGRTLGYSGAILALYLVKPVVLKSGYQATFFPSGFYFLIFALPCMIFLKDKSSFKGKVKLVYFLNLTKEKTVEISKVLKQIACGTYASCDISNFLKASFFALCSVNVIILFMSVYAKQVFRLDETAIIDLVAFSTLFAIMGSLLSGLISDYLGHKRLMGIVIILWIVCFLLGAFAKDIRLYWFIGALVGIVLGSTWVVSRALAMRLAPPEKIGETFGLFNLVGYLSAAVGSLFWGLVLLLLHPLGLLRYRIALLSLILFMLLGLTFLLRLPADSRHPK